MCLNLVMAHSGNELRKTRPWLLGAVVALGASACFAPPALPVRAVMAGAPGRLADGELELSGGTIGGLAVNPPAAGAPLLGGGWAAGALDPHLSLEIGVLDVPIFPGAGFGFFGGRWTGTVATTSAGSVFADVDLALGAGGTYCTPAACPGSRSPRVFEFGSAQGGALGFKSGPFSVYARVKIEEGKTALGPLMLWPFGVLGVELSLGHVVSLGVAGGGMSIIEPGKPFSLGTFYQAQATIFLDAPWRSDRERAPPSP